MHLFISLVAGIHCRGAKEENIPVMVAGLQPGKGQIILNVFKDKDSYNRQMPFRQIKFDKGLAKNGNMTIGIDLAVGVYGITLVDDTNKNTELDKNGLVTPTEGFGFSNYEGNKKNWPAFDDIKIVVKSKDDIFDGTMPINIRVKYI